MGIETHQILTLWSGRTKACICTVSMVSVLSHISLDRVNFLISCNCSKVKLLGHPPFS